MVRRRLRELGRGVIGCRDIRLKALGLRCFHGLLTYLLSLIF